MVNHPNRSQIGHRIRGDWMINGFIDNLNRRRWIAIEIVNGRAYLSADETGHIRTDNDPLTLDADGCIEIGGASVTFSPDEGEIEKLATLGVSIPVGY